MGFLGCFRCVQVDGRWATGGAIHHNAQGPAAICILSLGFSFGVAVAFFFGASFFSVG